MKAEVYSGEFEQYIIAGEHGDDFVYLSFIKQAPLHFPVF